MAKSPSSKSGKSWTRGLNKQKVREALEEATVDANDESEQHCGLLTVIEARSVELIEPLPKGHLCLAAYLLWKRFL